MGFNSEYKYHHMGMPANRVRPGEHFIEVSGMYISDADRNFRIQYHCYTPDSPLHPLLGS